jgi:hypothetical protein
MITFAGTYITALLEKTAATLNCEAPALIHCEGGLVIVYFSSSRTPIKKKVAQFNNVISKPVG